MSNGLQRLTDMPALRLGVSFEDRYVKLLSQGRHPLTHHHQRCASLSLQHRSTFQNIRENPPTTVHRMSQDYATLVSTMHEIPTFSTHMQRCIQAHLMQVLGFFSNGNVVYVPIHEGSMWTRIACNSDFDPSYKITCAQLHLTHVRLKSTLAHTCKSIFSFYLVCRQIPHRRSYVHCIECCDDG